MSRIGSTSLGNSGNVMSFYNKAKFAEAQDMQSSMVKSTSGFSVKKSIYGDNEEDEIDFRT